jgi:hypothetical protein
MQLVTNSVPNAVSRSKEANLLYKSALIFRVGVIHELPLPIFINFIEIETNPYTAIHLTHLDRLSLDNCYPCKYCRGGNCHLTIT